MRQKSIFFDGSSWGDYQWLHVLAALPFGLLIYVYWQLIAKTCSKDLKAIEHLPSNAILYTFHRDIHSVVANNCLYGKRDKRLIWLGYHGFLSYLFSIPFFQHKPHRTHERLVIFTDAGGPYGTVRATLIQLALKTGRPLVAFRHEISPSFSLLDHILPLPFSSVKASFSRAVSWHELKALSKKEALKLLQAEIVRLSS